jgi:CRISPR/Cas system CSM-associated protein Csm4 (group 5 of RAMP superfamily)
VPSSVPPWVLAFTFIYPYSFPPRNVYILENNRNIKRRKKKEIYDFFFEDHYSYILEPLLSETKLT